MKYHHSSIPTAYRRQRGITLLESLVALVISVLGILGILGMQMRTLTDSQTATRRAQAIRLIEDFSERLRVQPNALVNINSYVSDFDEKPSATGCTDTPCTPADLVTRDLGSWKQSVAASLPLGQARVFIAPWEDADSPTQVGVLVSWRANEADGLDTDDIDATQIRAADGTLSSAMGEGDACPTGRICHLQYISVAARCGFNADQNSAYCPGSQ